MTFGIVECNASDDLEKQIKIADNALYMGEKKGRNQVVIGISSKNSYNNNE